MRIVLTKPITFNGVEHKELELDLTRLTGNDLLEAEDMLRQKGIALAGAADYSRNYLLAVASRVLSIPPESLRELSARDFTRLINETLIFLAGMDSEESKASKQ